ncbi:MAG: Gfo/Idh/MocA family oxidoreductase [Clostridiales bacterium]|jgi:predicted dehydrogenase|nr:Gfo/Idh/MocA family oxidoreductase [Clostridiales bacterium]
MSKVKLGIIGFGNMGSGHSQYILNGEAPEVELVAIAERLDARRKAAGEALPGSVQVFKEGSDLIKSRVCDAVLVATPHYQHPELAMLAFEHGQHVMVEKPAGVYTLEVQRMNEAAKKHPELTFGLMFNQRTNALYRKMHEMIHKGEVGEIKRVNLIITDWYRTQYYYDSGAWRATWAGEGGGVLLNQCPHQLDLLQWLCGMPVKVHAFLHEGKWHDIEVEDDVTAYLEYENGATGVFITTTADAPGTNRLEVTGTLGRLVCENDKLTFDKLLVDERTFCKASDKAFAKPPMEKLEVQTDGANPQHKGVLNAFAANVLHGTPLVANGTEGINALMLSNAMHLSSWLGKAVTLPFDEQLFLEELNKRRATSRHKDVVDIVSDTEGSY